MLITKTVEVVINSNRMKLANNLESKGYTIVKDINKWGNFVAIEQTIIVNTEDLLENSKNPIEYACDYCAEDGIETVVESTYQNYHNTQIKSIIKKDACKKCSSKKYRDAMILRYGVENISQLESIKDKKKSTCMEHFGVPCNLTTDEVKDKIKQTNLIKYGCENVAQNEEVKEKMRQTNLVKYGVEWTTINPETMEKKNETFLKKYGTTTPLKTEGVMNKMKATNLERYGTEVYFGSEKFRGEIGSILKAKYGDNIINVSQAREVKIKKAESFYKNGTVATSNQQRYIWKLIGGELNYSDNTPSLDIAFPNEKLYIEYNGSGHDLCVKLEKMTQEEFENKERRRYYYLKNLGWNGIFINSPCDYLPTDEIIISEINKAKEWFKSDKNGHNHYNINIGVVVNDVNYGKVKRIKKEDLERFEEAI